MSIFSSGWLVAGLVVRGWVLAARASGAALRDRHQRGQGARHLTPVARPSRAAARLRPGPRKARFCLQRLLALRPLTQSFYNPLRVAVVLFFSVIHSL